MPITIDDTAALAFLVALPARVGGAVFAARQSFSITSFTITDGNA